MPLSTAFPCSQGCAPLVPAQLARILGHNVFPAAWQTRLRIGAEELTPDLWDKVATFWAYAAWYQRSGQAYGPPDIMRHFGAWPLLPTSDMGLVQIAKASVTLRLDQPLSADLTERAHVLARVGVAVLGAGPNTATADAAFAVLRAEAEEALPSLENAGRTSQALLHWTADDRTSLPFPDLSTAERHVLLRLLSQTDLDDTQLPQVRQGPPSAWGHSFVGNAPSQLLAPASRLLPPSPQRLCRYLFVSMYPVLTP